jgi:hypothetical protein
MYEIVYLLYVIIIQSIELYTDNTIYME